MKKAALFDLDGVLIDSETLYTQFWQRVGEIHHLPSPTFAYDIKGTTLKDILETHSLTLKSERMLTACFMSLKMRLSTLFFRVLWNL